MEFTKVLFCYVIILAAFADVILSRPATGREATGTSMMQMQTMLKDIDMRMVRSERQHARRRRRHVVTQNIAIMEFCIQNPHRCREEIARLRRAHHMNRQMTVVLIEK